MHACSGPGAPQPRCSCAASPAVPQPRDEHCSPLGTVAAALSSMERLWQCPWELPPSAQTHGLHAIRLIRPQHQLQRDVSQEVKELSVGTAAVHPHRIMRAQTQASSLNSKGGQLPAAANCHATHCRLLSPLLNTVKHVDAEQYPVVTSRMQSRNAFIPYCQHHCSEADRNPSYLETTRRNHRTGASYDGRQHQSRRRDLPRKARPGWPPSAATAACQASVTCYV